MSGNVSDWVGDVYRALSAVDMDDVGSYIVNYFETLDMSLVSQKG
jgi:hypothetical protein